MQNSYGLFLFFFRSQLDDPHRHNHNSISPTVLPSANTVLWYSACLLKFIATRTMSHRTHFALVPFYPSFKVYLTTIGGRYIHIGEPIFQYIFGKTISSLGSFMEVKTSGHKNRIYFSYSEETPHGISYWIWSVKINTIFLSKIY